ncbi:OpgC domain-containing protein, partial [Burkholderia cenocepacia]|uniref:OpgC domain-containing protein n=1 Tax=Burkholderia cenocepacia TaxID=95486 RepID=UPI003F4A3683
MRAYAYRRRSRSPAFSRSFPRCAPHRRRAGALMSLSPPPSVTVQPSRGGRLIEIDFFRGLVLLMIVVDHIGASVLSRVTLHAFALCDAAEVFVFLGGFATA